MAINLSQTETNIRRIVESIRQLIEGRSNATGTVTLRANQTTTTVTAINFGKDAHVFLSPLTANAAAAIPTTFVSTRSQGSFVLTHASNAQVDKSFGWIGLGG